MLALTNPPIKFLNIISRNHHFHHYSWTCLVLSKIYELVATTDPWRHL